MSDNLFAAADKKPPPSKAPPVELAKTATDDSTVAAMPGNETRTGLLVVDSRELVNYSARGGTRRELLLTLRQRLGQDSVIEAALPTGDFLWLARTVNESDGKVRYSIADWKLVERKSMKNLYESMMRKTSSKGPGGNLSEIDFQLCKMKYSGISNLVLLVESKNAGNRSGGNFFAVASSFLKTLKENNDLKKPGYFWDFAEHQIRYPKVEILKVKALSDTVDYLCSQHELVQEYLTSPEVRARHREEGTPIVEQSVNQYETVADALLSVKGRIRERMESVKFQWETELLSIEGLGRTRLRYLAAQYATKAQLREVLLKCATRQEMVDTIKRSGPVARGGLPTNIAEKVLDITNVVTLSDSD